ncbi:MAG: hypothetical protein HWN79_12075 [Candidatus Lokiarchaeota archaeon]|nr:hypothetical protein [Candidatus Lokiarchaeota archaeon]
MNRNKRAGAFCLIFVIAISFFLIPLSPNFLNYDYEQPTNQSEFIHSSGETIYNQEWLDNNGFSTQDEWFYNKGAQGDNSTTDANISGGSANYIVVGEDSSFSLTAGEANSSSWYGWGIYNNGDFLLPDGRDINSTGLYIYHFLDENEDGGAGQVHNFPSAHFRKNVSLPNDMSNFEIASASLDVIYNASVDYTVDTPLDVHNPAEITQPYPGFGIGDSATFYVEISDLARTYSFRVAENKTKYLGQWNSSAAYPSILTITDRLLETVSEEDLITALNLALEKDANHSDFTITIGIDIYCEDNSNVGDKDKWDALIIKSCNLTIAYQRKVDKFSSVSWNQIGNRISGSNIHVSAANLKFNYTIDQGWPTSLSPFSEIRIIINNNQHPQTVRLSSATTSWQEAKVGGFDVTNLILKDINISVCLQIFIANTFSLSNNISISIDDVYLNITYVESFEDYGTESQLFLETANKTSDPFIQIPLGNTVNITIKYLDNQTGSHISGATIQLSGKVSVQLTENGPLEQYSTVIDSTDLEIGIWSMTVTAQKSNYKTQIIPFFVEVVERPTDLQLYVNDIIKTVNNTVNIKYNEPMNITVFYRDDLTSQHLSGANVTITSFGDLTEVNEQYSITINSDALNLGFNVLTINAQSENYTSQLIQLYVEVFKRATEFELYVNDAQKANNDIIQIEVNQILNLTVFYRDDVTKAHLNGAEVTLLTVGNFSEIGNQYNYTLNSNNLSLGFNVLSIIAQIGNYESQSIQIYVEVYDIASELLLLVDDTPTIALETIKVEVNQFINLTVFYSDNVTKLHISGATVSLGWDNFTETGSQYYYNLNTNDLDQGITIVTIEAQFSTYQSQTIQIYFEVVERATELKLHVEGDEKVEKDTIRVNINQLLNVTVFYQDNLTKLHLSGAIVDFIGLGPFTELATQYYYSLNTSDLGLGFNAITISAQLNNYQFQNIQIFIEVVEKATELKLYVEDEEKVEKDTIQVEFNQLLNLTIFYQDNLSKTHLSGANITFIGIGNFNDIGTQYYYNLNSSDIGLGFNVITITAQLDDFQSQIIQIYVDVYEIPTELELVLNDYTRDDKYTLEVEVNEFINITFFYRTNSTKQFLNNANVELIGWGNFSEIGAQYNFTINTNDLEQGITVLTINAHYTNYLTLSVQFYVKVIERSSDFRLLYEGTQINETDTLSVEVNQFLNLTVFYQDNITIQHLSGATISLLGAGNVTHYFSDIGGQYYYLLNTNDLKQGITILSVLAYLENYQPRSFQFYVKVSERASEISLFLNSEEKTIDPVYELPFSSILNITVKYSDNQTKTHISGGIIQLIGGAYSDILPEIIAMNQYTLLLDTTNLKVGVNLFTIIAHANNFQVKSLSLRITLNKIATIISTTSGNSYFNIKPSDHFLLSLELTDFDFGGPITNANVTYRWAYGQGTLLDPEDDGTYEDELENIPTGTYTITITASAGDEYNFEIYKITLNVVSVTPPDFTMLVILIAGVFGALVVAFTLYEVRFKYPAIVRKSRKLRKKIKKGKKTKPIKDIASREDLVKEQFESNVETIQYEKKTENGIKEK